MWYKKKLIVELVDWNNNNNIIISVYYNIKKLFKNLYKLNVLYIIHFYSTTKKMYKKYWN